MTAQSHTHAALLDFIKVFNNWLMCVCVLYCQITMEGMKSDVDEVANQGIEFWSTVCDEEVDLAIELTEVRQRLIVIVLCSVASLLQQHCG